jgi:hypothetical protein
MKKRTLSCVLGFALLIPSLCLVSLELERLKITLQHRSVKSVAPRLMEELTSEGQIGLDTKRNTITVLDESPVIEKLNRMVQELDVPARHFAVSASLAVFGQKKESLFKNDEKLTDIADFMDMAKPVESYEGVVDILEGKKGTAAFGPHYVLSVGLGGYDPWERKISFESLLLERKSDKGAAVMLKASANLSEGVETNIMVPAKDSLPPVRLSINPTLLPSIEQHKEIP